MNLVRLPLEFDECAVTEWTATGITNSTYCAIPHGLTKRPDFIQIQRKIQQPDITTTYYDNIQLNLWRMGYMPNGGSNISNIMFRHRSSDGWTYYRFAIDGSHHIYADNTNVYLYSTALATYIPNGVDWVITAWRRNYKYRGQYEYTTDPTV